MKGIIRRSYILAGAIIIAGLAATALTYSQQKKSEEVSCPMMNKAANMSRDDCPMMKKGDASSSAMNRDEMVMKNGEKYMGFSQTATTHHFLIMKDGGAIRIETNDPNDTDNRDKIRSHLQEITKQFSNGIFTTPFAIHGQVPPGVPEMDKLKTEIQYTYEQTERGAQVRIKTTNSQALNAIHDFLKFQITEHKTGDPLTDR